MKKARHGEVSVSGRGNLDILHTFKWLRRPALLVGVLLAGTPGAQAVTTAEQYDPAWISELNWVGGNGSTGNLYSAPPGSSAWVETGHTPWWQAQTAHPLPDYESSKLPIGSVRLDGALDLEYTIHRPLSGWAVHKSPSGINNVYTFTPGSAAHQDRTGRMGQNAFFDFGFHPVANIMGDVGIEAVGNDDERFWFPVNDEHRMFKDDKHVRIVRGELKYDDKIFMIRGFEGTPNFNWVYQNDLFQLLPTALDVEGYRRTEGTVTPRGGEMRYASPFGTLDILGGTEPRFGYGSAVYAKYDAPSLASWENSIVYRNENIPFSLDPDERRWTLSLNSSWKLTEHASSHVGVLYQPFRLDRLYAYGNQGSTLLQRRTKTGDALGFTWRVQTHPDVLVDNAGVGYTYLGRVAGNKHQIDVDASRMMQKIWTLSGAYMFRLPVEGPQPLLFEGTASSPGALIASPRGPDDPFWVQWDNRKAHIASVTLVYDPTPETWLFKYQKNVLEDWNINSEEDARWVAAVQYRMTYYPTMTDRTYYWDECNRNLIYDPIFLPGARATSYPFSSATGLLRWKHDQWHVTGDLSGGQALAGNAIAYTAATNFYKPSTTFVQGGVAVDNSIVKVFARYGQDVWGPQDYHIQQGWAYHRVYQAGLSYIFLRDLETGFRYVGTRMTDEFIGSDTGAFNEYRFFLTYHFGMTVSLGAKYAPQGRPAEVPAAPEPVPPPPPPPVPVPPVSEPVAYTTQETDEGLKVTLNSKVLFDTNQFGLKDSSRHALDQVITLLREYPTNTLRISGHTDSVGSDAYNQKLSERRAQSVAHQFAEKGIPRSRMAIVGQGESKPIADNQTEEGRALNRRVEIDILKK